MEMEEVIGKINEAITNLEADKKRLEQARDRSGISDPDKNKIIGELTRIETVLREEERYRDEQSKRIASYERHMALYQGLENLDGQEQNVRDDMIRRIAQYMGTDIQLATKLFGSVPNLAEIEQRIKANPEVLKEGLKDEIESEAFDINKANGVVDGRVAARDKYRARGIVRNINAIEVIESDEYTKFDENRAKLAATNKEIAGIEALEQNEEAIKKNSEVHSKLQKLEQKIQELQDEVEQLIMDDPAVPDIDDEVSTFESIRSNNRVLDKISSEIESIINALAEKGINVDKLKLNFQNTIGIFAGDLEKKKAEVGVLAGEKSNLDGHLEDQSKEIRTKYNLPKEDVAKLTARKAKLQDERKELLERYGLPEDGTIVQLNEWKRKFDRILKGLERLGITPDNMGATKQQLQAQIKAVLEKYEIDPNLPEDELKALMKDINKTIEEQVEKIRGRFNERHFILTAEKMELGNQEASAPGQPQPAQPQQGQSQQGQQTQQSQQIPVGHQLPQGTPVGAQAPQMMYAGSPFLQGQMSASSQTGPQIGTIAPSRQSVLAPNTPQMVNGRVIIPQNNPSTERSEETEPTGYLDRTYRSNKKEEYDIPTDIEAFIQGASEDKKPRIEDGKAYRYAVEGNKLVYREDDIRRYIVDPKGFLKAELETLRDRMLALCQSEQGLEAFASADTSGGRFAGLVSSKSRERKAAVKQILKSIEDTLKDGGSCAYGQLEMFLAIRSAVTPAQVMEVLSGDVNRYIYESDLPQTALVEKSGVVFRTNLAVRQRPTLLQDANKTQHRSPKGVLVRPFEIPDSEIGAEQNQNHNHANNKTRGNNRRGAGHSRGGKSI